MIFQPQDWMSEVTADMLPGSLKEIAEQFGVECALSLMTQYGGTVFYIPKADNVIREIRDGKIIAEYNGYNTKKLALKYGLSEVQIYSIVRQSRSAPLPGQGTMFDLLESQ